MYLYILFMHLMNAQAFSSVFTVFSIMALTD